MCICTFAHAHTYTACINSFLMPSVVHVAQSFRAQEGNKKKTTKIFVPMNFMLHREHDYGADNYK